MKEIQRDIRDILDEILDDAQRYLIPHFFMEEEYPEYYSKPYEKGLLVYCVRPYTTQNYGYVGDRMDMRGFPIEHPDVWVVEIQWCDKYRAMYGVEPDGTWELWAD